MIITKSFINYCLDFGICQKFCASNCSHKHHSSLFLWFFSRKMLRVQHTTRTRNLPDTLPLQSQNNKPTNFCPLLAQTKLHITQRVPYQWLYKICKQKPLYKLRKTKHTFWHATIKCNTAIELSHSLTLYALYAMQAMSQVVHLASKNGPGTLLLFALYALFGSSETQWVPRYPFFSFFSFLFFFS